jgi:hypothetical protein
MGREHLQRSGTVEMFAILVWPLYNLPPFLWANEAGHEAWI